jgi:hypothetical protein
VPSATSPGVESVIDHIAEWELKYRDDIENALGAGDIVPPQHEEELLERLDGYLPSLVYAFDSQVPPPRERGGNLALEKEYYEWRKTSGAVDARRQAVVRSFLATETERRGQFRLNRAQNSRIAAHFDAIGQEFLELELPGHAAMAYQNAAELYRLLALNAKRDRSLLNTADRRKLSRHSVDGDLLRVAGAGLAEAWRLSIEAAPYQCAAYAVALVPLTGRQGQQPGSRLSESRPISA